MGRGPGSDDCQRLSCVWAGTHGSCFSHPIFIEHRIYVPIKHFPLGWHCWYLPPQTQAEPSPPALWHPTPLQVAMSAHGLVLALDVY